MTDTEDAASYESLADLTVESLKETDQAITPELQIIEFGDEKEIGFAGMKHLELDESTKERIHSVYADLVIDIAEADTEYTGADRLWHIGQLLTEYDAIERSEITLSELGLLTTVSDIDGPKLAYARHLYDFWPDHRYLNDHSPTSLGKLASRATTADRIKEAQNGYRRLARNDLSLTDTDVYIWNNITPTASSDTVISKAVEQYDTPTAAVRSFRRVWYLTDRGIDNLDTDAVETQILNEFNE